MLCQSCQQREALVHLMCKSYVPGSAGDPGAEKEKHLCEICADAYFASTPGMNFARGLICLSDEYRSRLYDLLEQVHPEAFDGHDAEACRRASELMSSFLREQLKKDHMEVNGDAFDMLCGDFYCSHHFYTRQDDFNQRKGQAGGSEGPR